MVHGWEGGRSDQTVRLRSYSPIAGTLIRLTRSWRLFSSRDVACKHSVVLPEDTFLEIATYLSPPDLFNLSITVSGRVIFDQSSNNFSSRYIVFYYVRCSLYTSVNSNTTQQCITTLNLLVQHSEITCHVRNLLFVRITISGLSRTNTSTKV